MVGDGWCPPPLKLSLLLEISGLPLVGKAGDRVGSGCLSDSPAIL